VDGTRHGDTVSKEVSMRVGILTGGGDAPGLNAVIRAFVKRATVRLGWEVYGIEDSFNGLLPERRAFSAPDRSREKWRSLECPTHVPAGPLWPIRESTTDERRAWTRWGHGETQNREQIPAR